MTNLLKNISKFFIYLAVVSPLILTKSLFFPFITGKALLFRTSVELALIFFVFYFIQAKSWNKKIFLNPIFLSVIGFGLVFLFTSLIGVSPYSSFWSNFERSEGAFQILHYVIFFILTVLLFNSKQEWRRLLLFSLFISFLISTYGFVQWIELMNDESGGSSFQYTINTGGRSSGTLGNPSYLAGYLLFHFLFMAWLLLEPTVKKWLKWVLAVLLLFELGVFITTETLAAILALMVGVFLAVMIYAWKVYLIHKDRPESKMFFYYSYIGSFLILLIIGGFIYTASRVDLYGRLEPRLWTWGSALSGIKENPVLGWGAENFPFAFDKYYNPNHYGRESWFDRTHNLLLEHIISGGLTLLLAYLLIFFFYYKKVFVMEKNWLWPIFAVGPVMYLIQGLTLFDVLAIYLVFYLFLAFFINYSNDFSRQQDSLNIKKGYKWLIGSPIIIVSLSCLYFGNYRPLQKNILISNSLRANEINAAVASAKAALDYYSPVGQQETYESLGRNFVIFLEQQVRQNKTINPAEPLFLEIMSMNGEHFDKLKGRLVGMKDFYLSALWDLAAFKTSKESFYLARARNTLDDVLSVAPRRIEFIIARIEVAELEKDFATREKWGRNLQSLRPDLIK